MGRIINLFFIAAMIAGAILTYDAKYNAERAVEQVAKLRHDIEKEKQTLNLLRAEWSVLTQPGRLQGLAERHGGELGLKPFDVNQIATIDEVPTRPIPGETLATKPALTGLAANATPMR